MDIRETKRVVLTEKNYYVLEHNYILEHNNNNCKINGVEFIPRSQTIYIITEVKNKNEIIMSLNIEDCNGVTIAKFRNIEVDRDYDFDEELSNNLIIIRNEIEKNENYYHNK